MRLTAPQRSGAERSEPKAAMAACKHAFVGVGVLSGFSNLLMLTGPLYMLEVYDRVLPSRSIPTLVALSLLAVLLFSFQAAIDIIRSRLLVRIGASLDYKLRDRVFRSIAQMPLRTPSAGSQPLRDLDNVRSFLSGSGPIAFFDLPWIPLYIAICFLFHIWIGMTALVGATILVVLAVMTETLTRKPIAATAESGDRRMRLVDATRRNAEVLTAMGMVKNLEQRWSKTNQTYLTSHARASDVAGELGAVIRVLRILLQSALLGVGGYLVILQEATAGIIIAGSILAGRALAPVDLAVANWRSFVAARQSWARLENSLRSLRLHLNREMTLKLPAPRKLLTVERISGGHPGYQTPFVQNIEFDAKAGAGIGVIGPSASGKSSLARMLVGIWPTTSGAVRLDGAELSQWDPDQLGRHIGYLPQNVELLEGTVAENISRFNAARDDNLVIAAAKAAGVHELIVRLPEGYQTQVGENGSLLSAGQRQRIALARALYGDPFLVVLDEPDSSLDAEGDAALTQAILGIRSRGGIVIVIAHRPSVLVGVDQVLVMAQGRQRMFGPKDEVLTKVLRRDSAPTPLRVA